MILNTHWIHIGYIWFSLVQVQIQSLNPNTKVIFNTTTHHPLTNHTNFSRALYDLKYTLDTHWIHIVQLGPSPNPKPKPWFWTKADTKVTFNTTTHHPLTNHTNFSRAWYDLKYTLDTHWIHIVQLGPSPNPKPKPWFWTKANTKVTFNTTTHHPLTNHTNFSRA